MYVCPFSVDNERAGGGCGERGTGTSAAVQLAPLADSSLLALQCAGKYYSGNK